jgi:hypothetical protein
MNQDYNNLQKYSKKSKKSKSIYTDDQITEIMDE